MESSGTIVERGSNDIECVACGHTSSIFICYKNNFPLYRCKNCKMLSSIVGDFNPDSFYNQSYFIGAKNGFGFSNYEDDKKPMLHAFQRFLKLISLTSKVNKGKLFDIGAATGVFVEIARKEGWEASGCELSEYAHAQAIKKELPVSRGSLRELNLPSETFDVVTLWDVIEHFVEPDKEIKEIFRILKPNGIIAFSTPDSGSLLSSLMKTRWHHIGPPEHIHYFNRLSIALFLKKHSFNTECISTINKRFTLQYLALSLARKHQLRFFEKLAEWMNQFSTLGKISIPINFHDTMFVIARK